MLNYGTKEAAIAKQSMLLTDLPDELADKLLEFASPLDAERGQTIFLQGSSAVHIYIVIDGWVKLYRTTPAGDEAVVGIFTRGQSFGEAVALRESEYPVTAEAVTEAHLLRIRGTDILRLMRTYPELCTTMLSACYNHLHSLVAQVEQLKAHTGPQRVAEFLADLAKREAGAAAVTLPYDKVLIAGRLGMQPESLSRAFARLRNEGVEVKQNQAIISDVRRLRSFAESGRGAEARMAE